MKNLFITLLLQFSFTLGINSQTLYNSMPTAKTSSVIRSLVIDNKGYENKDVIYAFHLFPNSCPRCEGLINPLIESLKQQSNSSSKMAFIMIYDYYNSKVPEKYQHLKDFHVESIVVDSDSKLLKSMMVTTNFLFVPYFYKINRLTGDILYSSPLLGMNINNELIQKILNCNSILPSTTNKNVNHREVNKRGSIPLKYDISLNLNSQNDTLSFPKACFYSYKRNSFIWLDDMFSQIYEIDNNGKVKTEISPLDQEFSYNVDPKLDKSLFNYMKGNNILNVIYLDILNTNKDKVKLVASLPKVTVEINKGDTSIDYFNEICTVTKSLNDSNCEIKSMDIPDSLVNIGYFTKHYLLKDVGANQYLLPLYKGWPVKGTGVFDSLNKSPFYNPFVDSFYLNNPLFLQFDSNRTIPQFIGSLPKEAKKYRWGYYFFKPVVDTFNSKIYYNNGMDDNIEIFSLARRCHVKSIKLDFPSLIHKCEKLPNAIKLNLKSDAPYRSYEELEYNFLRNLIVSSDSILYYILQNKISNSITLHRLDLKNRKHSSKTIAYNLNSRKDYFNLHRDMNRVYLVHYYSDLYNSKLEAKLLK